MIDHRREGLMLAVHDDVNEAFTIGPDEDRYPKRVLEQFGGKAPTLWALGNIDILESVAVGFCGSRQASVKGLSVACDAAGQLAETGVIVVSGNAAGVDLEAHRAALEVGGRTILVLPEGIDHFRVRKELRPYWDWSRVLVLSQFNPSAVWKSFRAMERNGLIIALSQAMIVIEAGETGGTLNAGYSTLKQAKPLFVALYENMVDHAKGNSMLLAKGGMRLGQNDETGRAAVRKIWDVISQPAKPSQYRMQSSFL
jgi:DNA processing protein